MKIHLTDCPKRQKYHYVNLITDAFRALGHSVFEFDSSVYSNFYKNIDRLVRKSPLYILTKKRPHQFDFKERYKSFISQKWIETLRHAQPDIMLMINSSWINRETVRAVKENLKISKMICWIVDDPSRSEAEDLVSLLPYFDNVFITDPGWIPFVKFFNEKVLYLPLASSDACYKPLDIKKEWDLSFVGSFFKNEPAGFFRAFMAAQLPKNYKFIISGPGINYFKKIYPSLNNFDCRDQYINIEDVNRLYNSSRLTLSIYNPQVIYGISPRIFEVALSKTAQVIQETATIHDLFPGVNLPLFRTTEELLNRVDYYLSHPREREGLTEEMFRITKEKHLFTHRIKNLLEFI